ncbi:hypothetical protein NM688_g6515 [Phlebia brevispora]|uniref:Uncharacterized protein n=1 Tax=Phlebia brevispora TaxID=194682 RepID=A0ACC1SFI8_9APHY|nr:hypothetical protein NM688_g6515 [Phlebia brevispora]
MASQLAEIAGKGFDYVVIGGGTAGLTVAARLVEDPSVSVAVLEAGEALLNDPLILLSGQYARTYGNPKYDWLHKTVPQKCVNNRQIPWPSGKGLGIFEGGSSAMNFLMWTKPHAADVDAWEKLGNPGWNWQLFQKHALRVEHFTGATEDQLADLAHTPHDPTHHGSAGPVKTTMAWSHSRVEKLFQDTLANMGVQDARCAYAGDNTGRWLAVNIMDRGNKWTRSYSATAYYLPSRDKPNHKVLTEALVSRIIFSEDKDGEDVVATGVEFIYEGQKYVVRVSKEVVVSAGTMMSPVVLERSGIGRKDVLENIGVLVRVDLPGVGENLQDHVHMPVSFELKPEEGATSWDKLKDAAFAQEQAALQCVDRPYVASRMVDKVSLREQGQKNIYWKAITSVHFNSLQALLPDHTECVINDTVGFVDAVKKSGTIPPGREEQYNLQLQALKDAKIPDLEFVTFAGFMTYAASQPDPDKSYLSIVVGPQHPFSRGSVHATSSDPTQLPTIDPHNGETPSDLNLMVKGILYLRQMAETEPFKSNLVREVDPGLDKSSEEELLEYVKTMLTSFCHQVGSLSMLPREKNGCVDTHLKVYGTKNVRVADISVIPLQVSAHSQCAAYVIGDILADILKTGHLE